MPVFTPKLRLPALNGSPSRGWVQTIDDGDWSQLIGDGPATVKWPFKEQGDVSSWEIEIKCLQDARCYYPIPAMTTAAVPSYLQAEVGAAQGYIIDPGEPSDAGNGLVSFTLILACIPIVRLLGGSTIHNFQFPDYGGSSPIIRQVQINVSCYTLWEYNLVPFVPFTAPQYYIGQGGNVYGVGVFSGVSFTLNSRHQGPAGQPAGDFTPISDPSSITAGTVIVGEDSTCDIYKSGIYYRKTLFITWPSAQEIDNG